MTETEKHDFIERFTEACGTEEPARIQRLLNISYQAARNYLLGRLPNSTVLLTIAEKTQYSLHWLLTGKGEKKIVYASSLADTPIAFDQFRALIRNECVEVINEALGSQYAPQPKIVVLQSGELKSEKIREYETFADKQS